MRRPVLLFALAAPLACSHASSSGPTARTCPLAAPAVTDWHLTPDGTLLRDSLGRVVALRGVDAGGRSKLAPFVPFDYGTGTPNGPYAQALGAYMDRAASWGIDVLRVPFVWAAVEPTQGQDDADFLSRYDQLLDAAWSRGLWTIVDFHQDVYSENFCGDGFPGWTLASPPAPHHDCPSWPLMYGDAGVKAAFDAFWAPGSAVQTAYAALWSRMVARYKDKPGVIGFEPINEPSAGSANADTWESTTLTDFYSRMVAQIRGDAPKALVFIDLSGPDGSFLVESVKRPAGDGVVFAPHFYPLSNAPGDVPTEMKSWSDVGASWNVPTFVGELGTKPDDAAHRALMAADWQAMDALGIGGSEWEYSASATSWNEEDMSIVDGSGNESGFVGEIARPYARAVAGSGVTQSWDDGARAFSLSYAPASGVTEVALPARAYANGYAVSLQGGCYDATSAPGKMLVQADPGATSVSLSITSK
jgi:endoglycosylceramidase